MRLLKYELDSPFDISTLSPEQLALIEEHTYGPQAEIRAATLVGDGLQAFVFTGMAVHQHRSGERDYYEFIARLVDEVSISETIDMFESEWFVEFARDIARAPMLFIDHPTWEPVFRKRVETY